MIAWGRAGHKAITGISDLVELLALADGLEVEQLQVLLTATQSGQVSHWLVPVLRFLYAAQAALVARLF